MQPRTSADAQQKNLDNPKSGTKCASDAKKKAPDTQTTHKHRQKKEVELVDSCREVSPLTSTSRDTQLLREPVVPHDLVSGRDGVTLPWHKALPTERTRRTVLRSKPEWHSTCARKRCGADCALALARADKNCAVSTLQRPPTPAANTTKRARPPSPESSVCVSSFLLRALCSATQSWLAALLETDCRVRVVRPTSLQLPVVPLATSHFQPLPLVQKR